MPEYFFHIGLEVFPDPSGAPPPTQTTPVDLTRAFLSLKPFLRSSNARTTRDTAFDRRREGVRAGRGPGLPLKPDRSIAEQFTPCTLSDHRLDYIHVQCAPTDMAAREKDSVANGSDPVAKGIGSSMSGTQTKGRYVPVEIEGTGREWGIVHLYRDANETPGLFKDSRNLGPDLWNAGNGVTKAVGLQPHPPPRDEDCTTLSILAVPSYLTPADFLAFVGEETREQVSHFRMIRTARSNRYMVLMKFKNGKKAREWQHEWNGRVFNSMEPETCHVVFLKSVEIMPSQMPTSRNPTDSPIDGSSTFPKMSNDPFVGSATTSKPLAPRTPSLLELPTCPVCLERMDETTGLLTILCQHVFHCTCLEKWSGGGCPVCRYTHDDFSTRVGTFKFKNVVHGAEYEVSDEALECETCRADSSLWQCLICGKVGCGRYEGKHAHQHFEESGHQFSMDLESKRVWDYAADVYVHRIIQDAAKPGEKLVELPGRRREPTALDVNEDIEVAKMENVALEYTHLLTSQLDSQRVYFEDIVQRTADKASEAAKKAESATAEYELLQTQLRALRAEHFELIQTKIPSLETERHKLERRSVKFEEMAKSINQKYLEEKSLASSLMERIKHLEELTLAAMQKRIQELEEDNATNQLLMEGLREEHHDAMMQISAQNKLREMVARGELDEEDLEGATIEAGPAAKGYGRKKGGRNAVVDKATKGVAQRAPTSRTAGGVHDTSFHEDKLTQMLREKLSLGVAVQAKDDLSENASRLIDEFKQRLLAEGVLTAINNGEVENHDDEDEDEDDENEGGPADGSSSTTPTTSKKKKAKKNRNRKKQ